MKKQIALALIIFTTIAAFAQGTAFTYHGRLTNNGTNHNGLAEFQPTLWDAVSGGTAVATNSPTSFFVTVTDGLFVMTLDFGNNFPGAARWLQLDVRTAVVPFTTLTPRQALTPTPYAITASNLTGNLPAAQLSGAVANGNLPANPSFSGVIARVLNSQRQRDPSRGVPNSFSRMSRLASQHGVAGR